MKRIHIYAVAAALIVAGAVKMVMQASAQATMIIPTCLGKSVAIPIEGASLSVLHCWGCYALLLGLVSLTALIVSDLRHSRLRQTVTLS